MEMQDIIFIIATVIFSIFASRQILYWIWLWQLKEYRFDRMRAHFQDIGAKNVFLAFAGYSALRQTKMPKLTGKSFLIIFSSLIAGILPLVIWFSGFVPFWKPGFQVIAAYFLVLITPLAILSFVLVLNFISDIFKRRIIRKAKEKISRLPNLTVIGITGSYGKSATKEILAEILSKKYKILKTPANINTAIGIAQIILKDLTAEHQIFIVEMGAYKKGEIREICEMANPKIGIITAINEQHLALFGSIENTIEAKFELIDSLPVEGLAILNIGDKNIRKGFDERNAEEKKIAAEVKSYSAKEKADFYATNVSASGRYVNFRLFFGRETQDFTLNAIGTHNISNALAAIIVAKKMGMGFPEISQILQRIGRLAGTFKIAIGLNGATFLDDTYNANPDGVRAALYYLKNQAGRKIVIMSSLIELGSSAHKIHYNLGKEISAIANKLILTDDYYAADIRVGASENKNSVVKIELAKNTRKAARKLKQDLKSSDTALFINRGAGKVLELLTRSTKAQG